MDTENLNQQVAIITGASSGIGWGMAERFANEGMKLVLAARREDKLNELIAKLPSGTEAIAVPTDVSNYNSCEQLVARTIERFGRVDVMINNAGNAVAKPLDETSAEEIDFQIDVNLKGVCYGSRAVVPAMKEQKHGFILNVGSICSFLPFPNYAAYVAAKFGVLGFSKALYEEVRAHGVRVHCLCPAAVNTAWSQLAGGEESMTWPREERIQPSDLAELAITCMKLPKRVNIDQLTIWPVCEATC